MNLAATQLVVTPAYTPGYTNYYSTPTVYTTTPYVASPYVYTTPYVVSPYTYLYR